MTDLQEIEFDAKKQKEPEFIGYELFDYEKLKTIYTNWNELDISTEIKDKWRVNGIEYDPRKIMRDYLNSSSVDEDLNIRTTQVNYFQSAFLTKGTKKTQPKLTGRLYASRCRSLQSLSCWIRHTIASEFYHDLDIVNCHPTILAQYCEKKKLAYTALKKYVSNRDELIKSTGLSKDVVKQTIIQSMFDSKEKHNDIEWIDDLDKEFKAIQNHMMNENQLLVNFIKEHKGEENIGGRVMSHILCDIENQIIQSFISYLKHINLSIKHIVLMFDGIMIPKMVMKNILPSFLNDLSEFIYKNVGYKVNFIVKPMDKIIDLTNIKPSFFYEQVAHNDTDAAQILAEYIGDRCVKSNDGKTSTIYIKNQRDVWIHKQEDVDAELIRYAISAKILKYNPKGEPSPYSENVSGNTGIIKIYKSIMLSKPFYFITMWEHSKGKIFFENGVYDVRNQTFRKREDELATDIAFVRLSYNYEPRNEQNVLIAKTFMNSIMGDSDIQKTLLQQFARALGGHTGDKVFNMLEGERDCGKGILTRLLIYVFELYIQEFNADNLLMNLNANSDKSRDWGWAVPFFHAPISISNEITIDNSTNNKVKYDGMKIKKLVGGDNFIGRDVYEKPMTFKILSMLFVMANDHPNIAPADAVESSKLFKFQFPYKFVSKDVYDKRSENDTILKPANEFIEEQNKTPKFRNGMFWLIMDNYLPEKTKPCAEVLRETMIYTIDNGSINDFIKDTFEFTNDKMDIIYHSEINDINSSDECKVFNITTSKFRKELAKKGAIESDDNKRLNPKTGKRERYMYGVRLIELDVNHDSLDI